MYIAAKRKDHVSKYLAEWCAYLRHQLSVNIWNRNILALFCHVWKEFFHVFVCKSAHSSNLFTTILQMFWCERAVVCSTRSEQRSGLREVNIWETISQLRPAFMKCQVFVKHRKLQNASGWEWHVSFLADFDLGADWLAFLQHLYPCLTSGRMLQITRRREAVPPLFCGEIDLVYRTSVFSGSTVNDNLMSERIFSEDFKNTFSTCFWKVRK